MEPGELSWVGFVRLDLDNLKPVNDTQGIWRLTVSFPVERRYHDHNR